ncbi:MAG: hypothetical protein R3F46_00425 [bacterium]
MKNLLLPLVMLGTTLAGAACSADSPIPDSAKTSANGLQYAFEILPESNGNYLLRLKAGNPGSETVTLEFPSTSQVNFSIKQDDETIFFTGVGGAALTYADVLPGEVEYFEYHWHGKRLSGEAVSGVFAITCTQISSGEKVQLERTLLISH